MTIVVTTIVVTATGRQYNDNSIVATIVNSIYKISNYFGAV